MSQKMKKKYLKYYIEKGIYKEEKYWYKKYYDKTWTTKKKKILKLNLYLKTVHWKVFRRNINIILA